jgi:hypothetical protein
MYLSKYEVRERVRVLLHGYWSEQQRTYAGFSDERFFIASHADIERYLDQIILPPASGTQAFDCDDFAFALKGLLCLEGRRQHLQASICVGIAWGVFRWMRGNHAVNWFLDSTGVLFWIEPQDRSLHRLDECVKGSLTLLLA